MITTTRRLLCLCMALSSVQSSVPHTPPPNVLEAIRICREKLNIDPHFPRIQHSLAQLLDSIMSNVDGADVDTESINEILQLYHAVGQPSSQHTTKERLPPPRIRFESLFRAGIIARDILHDKSKAIKYFTLAINIDGIDEPSLLIAFQTIMPLLLSQVNSDIQSSHHQQQLLQNSLNLCDSIEAKNTTESIIDEYRGATLRIMKQSELAYQSYHRAVIKSKQKLIHNTGTNTTDDDLVLLTAEFVRTSILAAAAAREAGYDIMRQMIYLKDAEKVTVPLLSLICEIRGTDVENSNSYFIDQVVDLYNNMGIAEKKHGSLNHAQEYFRKSLEYKPTDGHALVQLASISDASSSNDVVISNVKELDSEYVSALFDGYSTRFESELVDILHYKGHVLVYDSLLMTLKRMGKSSTNIKNVIDVGCGTGLLGALISDEMPWVEIKGVDLSNRMVEISRERKNKQANSVYGFVSNDDAATYLSTQQIGSIDCILASDVFIYIGDISKVLRESSKCLVTNGLIGFTVENYDASNEDSGLRLLPSGRFGHSRQYIDEVAKQYGFEVFSWDDCILRQQGGNNVKGATVILRKQE